VTGGNSQAVVARSLAPLVREGQVILLIQGNTGGSLIVRRALDDAGCRAEVDVAEMDNYPYSRFESTPLQRRVSCELDFRRRIPGGDGRSRRRALPPPGSTT
jgi:hypothetical protein